MVARPGDGGRAGGAGHWTLVAALLLIYVGNAFGPPPPEVTPIAYAGLGIWLLGAWGEWVDRHRRTHPGAQAPGR